MRWGVRRRVESTGCMSARQDSMIQNTSEWRWSVANTLHGGGGGEEEREQGEEGALGKRSRERRGETLGGVTGNYDTAIIYGKHQQGRKCHRRSVFHIVYR